MDREQVLTKLRESAVEVLGVDAGQVTSDARFKEDLDADSLDLVELVMALEETFEIKVEEEELEGIETVGAAVDLVAGKAGAAA
jgi:acyl carrier protein